MKTYLELSFDSFFLFILKQYDNKLHKYIFLKSSGSIAIVVRIETYYIHIKIQRNYTALIQYKKTPP